MSAAALAGWAADDVAGAPPQAEAVTVQGYLEPFQVPDAWADVRAVLQGTTYLLSVEDMDATVLLTGMEPGWEEQDVLAEAEVILDHEHPQHGHILVLKMKDLAPLFG